MFRAQTAQPHSAQLGFDAAVCRAAHAVKRLSDHATPRDQRRCGQSIAQLLQAFDRVRRRNQRRHIGFAGLDQQCITNKAKHLVVNRSQIAARVVIIVNQCDCRCQITGFQVFRQPDAVVLPQNAQRRRHGLLVHCAGSRRAVEHGERITHRAIGQTCNQARRAFGQLNSFTRSDIQQAARNVLRADTPEIKPLAARQDSRGHFMQLGRRQNKQHMLRRLFERLEQRIERADRKHVHLVDDKHALFDLRGRVSCFVTQIADIVHTVVGSCVDLGYIKHGTVQNAAAGRAFVTRIAVRRMLTVDRARQNFRTGCFARAARAGKQVRVAKPPGSKLRAQCIRNMLLTDHIRKGLRPPFAIQRLIHAPNSFPCP